MTKQPHRYQGPGRKAKAMSERFTTGCERKPKI